ncbi:TIGR03943 family protein [Canibacter sp. lx-45]|uniref:TIGR03943 family putative permease subunit n=1 Tax=Canibacter zhuwentaonis TaxID=2837491 RepID=UPI001BDD57AE|nr:TIGR03943 family protein [Canibacter zhuwentaonis]MBT1035569.1 TIGR03943 family protein [Canibacter zhuwentaonis]
MFKKPQLLGKLLALAACICALALIVTGKLTLYVHPRYTVFTLLAAIIALLIMLGSEFARIATCDGITTSPPRSLLGRVAGVIAALILIPLVLLPPASLSAERASTGTKIGAAGKSSAISSANGDSASRSIADWANTLAGGIAASELSGQAVDVTGFVAADDRNPQIMRVSRYSVTCCVVDAQALSVPVYMPNWQTTYQPGQWVRVTGFFINNPNATALTTTLLHSTSIEPVQAPQNPYLAVN